MPQLRPTIRFGVMCDSTSLDAWQARCIQELLAIPGVELALVIGNHGRTTDTYQTPLRGAFSRLLERVRHGWLLWTLFHVFWVKRRTASLKPVDMSGTFAGVPVINCRVELRGRFSEHFLPDDVARVRQHQLDFILRFGFNIIRGDILSSARHGVWSYHHDDPSAYRGRPAGFWEVFNGDACSGCVLQRLTDALDDGHMLRRGIYQTRPGCAANLDALLTASSSFAAHACREFMDTGAEPLSPGPPPSPAIVGLPSDALMLRFFFRSIGRFRAHLVKRSLIWHWNVGIVPRRIETLVSGRHLVGPEVRWLEPDSRSFSADPFILGSDANRLDLLVEHYEYAAAKGTIVALSVSLDGRCLSRTTAIDEPWHLAYPHVVRIGDEVWCSPEAAHSKAVSGYRRDSGTGRWIASPWIGDIRAIDPTFVQHQDRWWLFYTDGRIGDTDNLCIAWSSDINGPWTHHPRNPVKIDVRSSRPAGSFFLVDGQLYRPAQDCSRSYGGAISINRVRSLNDARFDAEEVSRIEPHPDSGYPSGLHTLSAGGGVLVIDGLRHRFAPWLKLRGWLAERRR